MALRRKHKSRKESVKEKVRAKESVTGQLSGFLLMYELKRHQTFKTLSEQLKQTDKFKREFLF